MTDRRSVFEMMNGGLLKALAVFGALAIMVVVLILLQWAVKSIWPGSTVTVLETMIAVSALTLGGGAAVRYAGNHEVRPKSKGGADGSE